MTIFAGAEEPNFIWTDTQTFIGVFVIVDKGR